MGDDMKKILHKWHWYWFKRHMKWLLTEQRDIVYNTLYQSINDYLMNDINKICIVDKPFTEDDVIQLCNAIEHNSWTNLYTMTQFENGVIKIDENRV